MSSLLDYLKQANSLGSAEVSSYPNAIRIALVTNFTDDLCKKILTGMCLSEQIYPTMFAVPYGQYHFQLKDTSSELFSFCADITFVMFDVNSYTSNEFSADPSHAESVLEDLRAYCRTNGKTVVANTLPLPIHTPHGNLIQESPLVQLVVRYNAALQELARECKNLYLVDTDRLMRVRGERAARDLRSLYAFRQPFSHDFLLDLSREWFAYVRALLGKTRKCIVVDLDNTLWGGVVGEVGALGITLGPDYPGNAFQEFQRVLLGYYERGVILAINSRNNPEDVTEVFEKNRHMVLAEKHFSALSINWKTKAENLVEIAKELNIGLDSLVFLDDDAMNRDLVRTQLPQVLVPDFSLPPEDYAHALLSLDVFHQLSLTEEDAARGRMYAEERQRKSVQSSATTLDDYLSQLQIKLETRLNAVDLVPRLAQLTQKTNQFNLTTKRYTEQDIHDWMARGLVFSGDVFDKFGAYGITVEAIVELVDEHTARLDTFLMSCRVMGRQVERAFFSVIAQELRSRGIETLLATFIPSSKNMPAADFLPGLGCLETTEQDGMKSYTLQLNDYLIAQNADKPLHIQIASLTP